MVTHLPPGPQPPTLAVATLRPQRAPHGPSPRDVDATAVAAPTRPHAAGAADAPRGWRLGAPGLRDRGGSWDWWRTTHGS